jgi:clan AA aspartic protease (TIGR02281 family)
MVLRLALIAVLIAAVGWTTAAGAGYLDENPDEVFAAVYARLGTLPVRAARDPYVWLRLEELKREPCDQTSVNDLALSLEKLGYRREAAQGLYNFVRLCGAPTSALHRSVEIFLKLSDYAMAVEVADEFVRREPSKDDAHYLRGVALEGAKDFRRAVADYAEAIELFTGDRKSIASRVFLRMGNAYAALGQFCEAATPIYTWVAIDPVTRDTSATQKIIADYELRGHCASSKEARKERYPLGGQRGVVTVKAEINGVRGVFIIDTGASYAAMKPEFADRAKIPQADASEITLSTANGPAQGKLSKADKVVLGRLEADNVPVVVQKSGQKLYGAAVDGLLGMSFLSRFEMQMAGGFIEIRTRRPK